MKTIVCSECGAPCQAYEESELIIGGLCFSPREWGYYNGFTDFGMNDAVGGVNLCHDCSLMLLRSFSSIAKALGDGGHHPCSDDQPCCEYAWRSGNAGGLERARYRDGYIRWEAANE